MFLLLTLNRFHTFSSASIFDFEQVNVSRNVHANNSNKKAKSPKLVLIQGKKINNQYPLFIKIDDKNIGTLWKVSSGLRSQG